MTMIYFFGYFRLSSLYSAARALSSVMARIAGSDRISVSFVMSPFDRARICASMFRRNESSSTIRNAVSTGAGL